MNVHKARPTPKLPHHDCPGGCGTPVPHHRFACPACWARLPRDLRTPITGNYRRDFTAHAAAMADARRWYGENPLRGRDTSPDAPTDKQEPGLPNSGSPEV